VLNKKTIQALAYSGTLDELGGHRAQLSQSYDEISTYAKVIQGSLADGQTDIFGMMDESETPSLKLSDIAEASAGQKLKWEKEYLGLYVSGHPLQGLKKHISGKGKLIRGLGKQNIDKTIKVTGMISQNRRVMTKKGKYMCFGEIEDPSAKIPFVLFPRTYEEFGSVVDVDKVLTFHGKLSERADEFQIIVNQVKPVSLEAMTRSSKHNGTFDENDKILGVPTHQSLRSKSEEESKEEGIFVIEIDSDMSSDILHYIKPLLEKNKGETPVEIHITQGDKLKRIKVPFGIEVTADFKSDLSELLK
ncbi:MAG: DNA polymerase III alpha subunit, partial [Oceanicoccus sp.]